MVELFGGAPPVMAGISLVLVAGAWAIDKAGPELREWMKIRERRRR